MFAAVVVAWALTGAGLLLLSFVGPGRVNVGWYVATWSAFVTLSLVARLVR